ncbi:MAG: hypothetical protein PHE27_08110 [Alphaproteobacteria bacterium]|nr:hypothetical protein [Alphaproteobacteria bacterium]
MPWRREEVAPYVYDDVYVASTEVTGYYTSRSRTPEEMEEANARARRINQQRDEEVRERAMKRVRQQEMKDALART